MKKLLTVFLLGCCLKGWAQTQPLTKTSTLLSPVFNISVYYGTQTKLGVDLMGGKQTILGLGISMHVGKGGVGKDYSETIGPNAFADDIYDVRKSDLMGIYGIVGSRLGERLILAGKLGAGTKRVYYNGYDNYQILSPNGYWYTSSDGGTKILVGGLMQYRLKPNGNWTAYVGADNFSGLNLGFGIIF